MTEKVVIIGGGAAGPKTAAKLRRLRSDFEINLYTQEDIISYSACGLPYFIENIIHLTKKTFSLKMCMCIIPDCRAFILLETG